jgi:hypothetical protein
MSIEVNQCGLPQDILHLLAATLVKGVSDGQVKLRICFHSEDCNDFTNAVTCENSHLPPEKLLEEIFTTEDCGNLIMHISYKICGGGGPN